MQKLKLSMINCKMTTAHFKMNSKGVALILVLLVLLLLMVVVLEFSFAMRVEVKAARNFNDEINCYFYAQTGFQRAVAELIKHLTFRTAEGEEETLWRDDQRRIQMLMTQGKVEVIISNERGKYDLNTIPDDLLRNLISTLGVGELKRDIITDSILDWRDDDNFHRINGAEDDYYESLPNPYSCKDRAFETVEELLLVRGVTPQIFYGSYMTGDDDEDALPLQKGLVDIVTVYSRSTRVDVNSAPKEVLLSIPGLSEDVVEKIIEARSEEPIKNLNDIRVAVGDAAYMQAFKYLSFSPSWIYSIIATGTIPESGVKRRIKGVVRMNLRAEDKFQIVYWADNYPIPENIVPVSRNLWEKGDEEKLS